MKVSIIIPAYNYGDFLKEAVDSVLAQTYENFELLIVVDGDSTDQSEAVAKRCAQECPNKVRTLCTPHLSPEESRNFGLAIATGDCVLFLDADDYIDSQYLEKTIPLMTEGVGVVSTDMLWDYEIYYEYVSQESPTSEANSMPITSLIRKEVANQVNGFDPTMLWSDWDLWLRILKTKWKIVFLHEPLFYHRVGPNKLTERIRLQGKEADQQIQDRHGEKA